MKKQLLNFGKIVILLFSFLFVFNSCSDDDTKYTEYTETNWKTMNFTVNHNDWKWDATDECYYYEFDVPELSQFIVTDGLVDAAVLLGSYRPLSFTANYYDQTNNVFYSEVINYEYATRSIRFNVTSSILFDNTSTAYLPQTYNFKVTLVW